MNSCRQALSILVVVCAFAKVPSCHAQIQATPQFSQSPAQRSPQVSGLTSKEVEDRVNALLVAREKEDREIGKGCLESEPGAPKPSFKETVRLTYISPRLLSIDVRTTDFGCAPYPNIDIPKPLTIDLIQGKTLDWENFFVDGFLKGKNESSPITKLYLRHAQLDEECAKAVNDWAKEYGPGYDLWLNKQRGLMIEPSLPHVVRACAKLVSVPFGELQDSIRDEAIRQEFTVAASSPTK